MSLPSSSARRLVALALYLLFWVLIAAPVPCSAQNAAVGSLIRTASTFPSLNTRSSGAFASDSQQRLYFVSYGPSTPSGSPLVYRVNTFTNQTVVLFNWRVNKPNDTACRGSGTTATQLDVDADGSSIWMLVSGWCANSVVARISSDGTWLAFYPLLCPSSPSSTLWSFAVSPDRSRLASMCGTQSGSVYTMIVYSLPSSSTPSSPLSIVPQLYNLTVNWAVNVGINYDTSNRLYYGTVIPGSLSSISVVALSADGKSSLSVVTYLFIAAATYYISSTGVVARFVPASSVFTYNFTSSTGSRSGYILDYSQVTIEQSPMYSAFDQTGNMWVEFGDRYYGTPIFALYGTDFGVPFSPVYHPSQSSSSTGAFMPVSSPLSAPSMMRSWGRQVGSTDNWSMDRTGQFYFFGASTHNLITQTNSDGETIAVVDWKAQANTEGTGCDITQITVYPSRIAVDGSGRMWIIVVGCNVGGWLAVVDSSGAWVNSGAGSGVNVCSNTQMTASLVRLSVSPDASRVMTICTVPTGSNVRVAVSGSVVWTDSPRSTPISTYPYQFDSFNSLYFMLDNSARAITQLDISFRFNRTINATWLPTTAGTGIAGFDVDGLANAVILDTLGGLTVVPGDGSAIISVQLAANTSSLSTVVLDKYSNMWVVPADSSSARGNLMFSQYRYWAASSSSSSPSSSSSSSSGGQPSQSLTESLSSSGIADWQVGVIAVGAVLGAVLMVALFGRLLRIRRLPGKAGSDAIYQGGSSESAMEMSTTTDRQTSTEDATEGQNKGLSEA